MINPYLIIGLILAFLANSFACFEYGKNIQRKNEIAADNKQLVKANEQVRELEHEDLKQDNEGGKQYEKEINDLKSKLSAANAKFGKLRVPKPCIASLPAASALAGVSNDDSKQGRPEVGYVDLGDVAEQINGLGYRYDAVVTQLEEVVMACERKINSTVQQ